jgi:hypothetical protein
MKILIKADNPKGLAYEFLMSTPEAAKNIIRKIIAQGGLNITINGRALPEETRAFIAGTL